MFTKMMSAFAAIIATSSLFFGATEAQAQVYSNFNQGFGNYRQSTQFSPYRGTFSNQQFNSGYRMPTQNRFTTGLSTFGGNNNWNNNRNNWNNTNRNNWNSNNWNNYNRNNWNNYNRNNYNRNNWNNYNRNSYNRNSYNRNNWNNTNRNNWNNNNWNSGSNRVGSGGLLNQALGTGFSF